MTPGHTYTSGSFADLARQQVLKLPPPVDIGVSMKKDVLEHKKRDGMASKGRYCYWDFPLPISRGVSIGSRLWVANLGRWVGYFVISSTDGDGCDADPIRHVEFYSESWVTRDGGPRRPFQGFTLKVPKMGPMRFMPGRHKLGKKVAS